jgi:transcription-repair coupling factor (superfamily II helicase)
MSPETTTMPPLADLPSLLAGEAAVRAVMARDHAVAVPEAARALFVASLAGATTRRPLLLAVPTGVEAERLARDLTQFLGAGAVELFPAWETLPFERVSPSLETMGRRLRVLWRLRETVWLDSASERSRASTGERASADRVSRSAASEPMLQVVVAPVRALVQRLGPHLEEIEPVVVRPGAQLDRDELVETLVRGGYRREYQVEARGEVAVRGSIVDVYPSTDDHPVRIDLWGDEVDGRRTTSTRS